jgi:energy-coupling factor transport system ATP-binding protein
VIALERGAVVCDGDPSSFLRWAAEHAPALQTPGAKLFDLAGIEPPPSGVREARARLRSLSLLPEPDAAGAEPRQSFAAATRGRRRVRRAKPAAALEMHGVWHELRDGPAILRGVSLRLQPGESAALMGRNGAGKSTLLRHAAGLLEPTRGKLQRAGRVALLLQNPGDYLIHERVEQEASPQALAAVGLAEFAARNPRDLSGGERQRLALAIVSDGEQPAVLALDEPTRGMDRAAKLELAVELRRRAEQGQAVIVATHDPEFAATCADRALLLADGRVIADSSTAELLSGGWYFATETARILGGAGGALLPAEGAELLRRDAHVELAS